jgi:hypothetical protein
MSSTPQRPGSDGANPVSKEVEEIVRQRLAEIENDEKSSQSWSEVRERILRQPDTQ